MRKQAKRRAGGAGVRPPIRWPRGVRAAVCLTFDLDAETAWISRDPENERRLAVMSQGAYGPKVGVPLLLDLLARNDLRATFFVPGVVAELYPDEQRRVVGAGHEIGIHSWIHELNSQLPPEAERDLQMRACDTLERITGRRPVGIRTPSWDFSAHTLAITRDMGLLYDSSLMADDEPYELLDNGEPTGVVELPVEWIKDDAPYFGMHRASSLRPYTPPSAVLEIFKAEFDGAVAEGGLFLLTMHPHIIGRRSRIALLVELLEHMKSVDGVWFATHEEVARYCLAHAPHSS